MEENKKIEVTIPELAENEARVLVRQGDNYILTDIEQTKSIWDTDKYIEKAQYDADKIKHIYSTVLDNESSISVTSIDEITSLAQNTQNSINKVQKINGIVKYYVNKEDLIGRVVETIENNVNTQYKIDYPYEPKIKKDRKRLDDLKQIIDKFNKQIDISSLIRENALNTYTEGNNIMYLMGDKDGYSVVNYPLDMIEVTSMKIDGDNIVSFNTGALSSKLQSNKAKFSRLKSVNKLINIETITENEIKRDYPNEVYDSYMVKDNITLLNPQRVGLVRINQLKGLYGLTPIFKALVPQLLLETIDKSDQKVLVQKTKKIYFQSLRKEIIEDPKVIEKTGYSQASLLKAMGNETIVYTSAPFVEDLKLIEPKTELTDANVKSGYKLRILEALGISFISSQGSSSITTTKINYNELLKIINRITKRLENIINKWYQLVTVENGFPIEISPKITIEDTEKMDLDSKLRIADLYYSKIGLSYESIFDLLGLDYQTEKRKREAENKDKLEEVFLPHSNSYTSNSNDLLDNNKNSNNSTQNENLDKREYDQQRNDGKDMQSE